VTDADERTSLEAFVGRTLQGRYRIDALLGMGGMGGVFRAHHLGLAHDVAIKVLRSEMRSGHIAPARFQREARSASRLDHPNCVRVTDFGELEDGTKFLVMELLVGDELKRRLGAPLDPAEAIDIALQILDGLEHAHAHGVVHRDLKPENVLLTADHRGRRRIKLVDFGIAKLLEGDDVEQKLTRTGMLFGTPRYMSPEQAGGGKVDARTDLYAVGLLLYEMLAGHPPFEADDVATLMRMHVLVPPPPLPATVPPELVAVVMRLLAKTRADRFATAADTSIALDLARTKLAPSVSAVALTLPSRESEAPAPRKVSHRQLFAASVLLVLGCIGVLAFVFAEPSSPAPTPPAPVPVAVEPPPMPAASGSRACRGDDCECDGNEACDLQCTDDCEVECGGRAQCTIDVGDDGKVECKGSSRCVVNCRGDCRVECRGNARCEIACADGSVPGECGKGTRVCGRCR
jgi:serine/threonine protein kinase